MAAYISVDELENLGIHPQAIALFDDAQKEGAILAASDEADAYIRQVTGVPFVNPPLALKVHVAKMAVYHLMSVRGMDPDSDKLIVDNYERAIRFFTAVAKRTVALPGMTPPADDPSDDLDAPFVISDPPRWP